MDERREPVGGSRRHAPMRRLASLLMAFALVATVRMAIPPSVAACSCMGPQPMIAYAEDPSVVIFTGVPAPMETAGQPAVVTRWFKGGGILEPRVVFDASGFGEDGGASCMIPPLPVGGEYIFVAYRTEGQDTLGLGLCSPHAPVADAAGAEMLRDAMGAYAAVTPTSASDPPANPEEAPASAVDTIGPIAIVIGAVGLAGVLFGAVLVFGRRRGTPEA